MNVASVGRPILVVALTAAGRKLGQRLQQQLPDAVLSYRPKPFAQTVQQAFTEGKALVLITATGIAVRTLAPVLTSKHDDPPVLVLDEAGRFVIPLLSGHEGGANDWGAAVADMLGAQFAMTTAKPYLKPTYTVGMGCERGCPADHLQGLLEHCLEQAGLALAQIESINSIDIKADERGLIEMSKYVSKPYQTFSAPALRSVEDKLSTRSD